jgi:hypothetical protein
MRPWRASTLRTDARSILVQSNSNTFNFVQNINVNVNVQAGPSQRYHLCVYHVCVRRYYIVFARQICNKDGLYDSFLRCFHM